MKAESQIKGCILALACGDALGAPVEFIEQTQLLNRYGPQGITELEKSYGIEGAYTDDTQMSIATARGVIQARSKERQHFIYGKVDPAPYIYTQYIDWLALQAEPGGARGPGNTCLTALRSGEAGHVSQPINDSKGCGGVMRVAPIGLVYDPTLAWRYGVSSAALTHGHLGGYMPAGFQAMMISCILGTGPEGPKEKLNWAFRCAVHQLRNVSPPRSLQIQLERWQHLIDLLEQAITFALSSIHPSAAAAELGEGWCGDEALALALYFSLRYVHDLREAVQKAVLFSGDRDSVGCITGALMGALHGYEAVPASWLDKVEGRAELEKLAEELCEVAR